jgi:hypothetical protein
MLLTNLWGQCQRPWGYEIRADYEHNGMIYNEVLNFSQKPDQKTIDRAIADRMVFIQNMVDSKNAEKPLSVIDKINEPKVNALLKEIYQTLDTLKEKLTGDENKDVLGIMDKIFYAYPSAAVSASAKTEEKP